MLLVQEGHAVTSGQPQYFSVPKNTAYPKGPASRGAVEDSDRAREVQGHFVPHHSATWG